MAAKPVFLRQRLQSFCPVYLDELEVVLGVARDAPRERGRKLEHISILDHTQTGVYIVSVLLDLAHQRLKLAWIRLE